MISIRTCLAAFAAVVLATAASGQDLPPASDFARLPAMESPTLSPDGSMFAHLENRPEGAFLVVRNSSDFEVVGAVDATATKARGVLWAADDVAILVVSNTARNPNIRGPVEIARPIAVQIPDMTPTPLMDPRRSRTLRNRAPASRISTNRAQIVGVDRSTGELLIPDISSSNTIDLYAVDPSNDRRRAVADGATDTMGWVANGAGEAIARIDFNQQPGRDGLFQIRVRDEDGFWPITYQEETALPETNILGPDGDGNLILAMRSEGDARTGLYPMSMETGEIGEPLLLDETYDIGGYHFDPYTNTVLGAVVVGDTAEHVWFDEDFAAQQEAFDASFGGAEVAIESWSMDRSKLIFSVSSGEAPTVFYMLDRDEQHARAIQTAYPEAMAAGVAPRLSIRYPARDGEQVPGYLTVGDEVEQPAPLVVLPHGGPESRDVSGFHWLAHFLASRGYAVLQPNFRGSSGYGEAWRDAGRGGWGTGVMQHDVSDGVDALVEAGIADPDKVCIVGASYGGYAALAGAVYTPELYSCAVAIAGVSDLNSMISYERDRRGFDSFVIDYWEEVMGGDLGAARSRLADMSPHHFAENAAAPVLLIHGRDDSVVPISQSRRMEDALSDAGKPVEFIELDGEDHWLSGAETRLATLEALDAFLAEHLGD